MLWHLVPLGHSGAACLRNHTYSFNWFQLMVYYGMVLNSWLFRAWERIPMGGLRCLNASQESFWRFKLEPNQTDKVRPNLTEPNIWSGNTFEGLDWGPTTVWFWILDFSGRESVFRWADFVASMHLGSPFGTPYWNQTKQIKFSRTLPNLTFGRVIHLWV